jgi:hypothetical protein
MKSPSNIATVVSARDVKVEAPPPEPSSLSKKLNMNKSPFATTVRLNETKTLVVVPIYNFTLKPHASPHLQLSVSSLVLMYHSKQTPVMPLLIIVDIININLPR